MVDTSQGGLRAAVRPESTASTRWPGWGPLSGIAFDRARGSAGTNVLHLGGNGQHHPDPPPGTYPYGIADKDRRHAIRRRGDRVAPIYRD
jgi:hypothetical protein